MPLRSNTHLCYAFALLRGAWSSSAGPLQGEEQPLCALAERSITPPCTDLIRLCPYHCYAAHRSVVSSETPLCHCCVQQSFTVPTHRVDLFCPASPMQRKSELCLCFSLLNLAIAHLCLFKLCCCSIMNSIAGLCLCLALNSVAKFRHCLVMSSTIALRLCRKSLHVVMPCPCHAER